MRLKSGKESHANTPNHARGRSRMAGPACRRPAEQQYPRDHCGHEVTIPAGQAFRPLAEGGCPLLKS